jgi:hypothetical protein
MPRKKERNTPQVGTTYTKMFKGKPHTMRVVSTDSGISFMVGGNKFPSPTGAAKSITKTDVNGWKFWGIE